MERRRCLWIDRLRIEELFYDDICGACRFTERSYNAHGWNGQTGSCLFCEIYGTSSRRSQWKLATIILIGAFWRSQRYRKYGLESVRCPSFSCISTSLEQGDSACRRRSVHSCVCNILLVTTIATRPAELLLCLQRKQRSSLRYQVP